ncbi:MAG TPA: hypothetical protein VN673_08370, partial [Clostridia bacterium]|nr:hypothetical protein [Clostridia bacterium]
MRWDVEAESDEVDSGLEDVNNGGIVMFRRLHQWLGRFLGVITTEPAKNRPEAVLNTHKMALQKQIAAYDRALASRAAFCEVLREQASKLEVERDRLNEALERQAIAPV